MVFGLFGTKVERLKKAVRQRYGQHEPRKDAMVRLLQMGTLDAYRAVISRFTVNCDSPHWDEKEKRWLADQLTQRGGDEALIQALEELLMNGERLNQALAAVLEVVRDVLDRAWSLHCRRRRIFKGSAASGSGARNASAVAFDARTTHESRHGTCDERASDVPGSADEAGDVCASPMRGD